MDNNYKDKDNELLPIKISEDDKIKVLENNNYNKIESSSENYSNENFNDFGNVTEGDKFSSNKENRVERNSKIKKRNTILFSILYLLSFAIISFLGGSYLVSSLMNENNKKTNTQSSSTNKKLKKNPLVKRVKGMAPIHKAAIKGDVAMAKKELESGVFIDLENENGETPMRLAITNNQYEMVVFLFENGAEIRDEYNYTIIDIDIITYFSSFCKTKREEVNNPPQYYQQDRNTYELIKNGDLDSLKNMVKEGNYLSFMTYRGEPAPCIAIKFGKLEILKFLVDNYDYSQKGDNAYKRSCLHYAVKYKNLEALEYLLKYGYDPNVKDLFGNTPLHYASEDHCLDYAKCLLKYGADANCLNSILYNPIFHAVNVNNYTLLKILKEKGANIDNKDIEKNTALQLAKYKSFPETINELHNLGADARQSNRKFKMWKTHYYTKDNMNKVLNEFMKGLNIPH